MLLYTIDYNIVKVFFSGYILHVVQHILTAYFIPNSLHLLLPDPSSVSTPITGKH